MYEVAFSKSSLELITNGVTDVVIIVVGVVVLVTVAEVITGIVTVVCVDVMTSFTIPKEAHEVNGNNPATNTKIKQIIFFNFHPT
jgi:hypothetical protein